MEFEINEASTLHGYQQLAEWLRTQIAAGKYTDRLPSYKQLEDLSGLSLSTVQHAVKMLVQEGLVTPVRGRGVFVKKEGP